MRKIKREKRGGGEAEILRRGKFADGVLFCPCCDDLSNTLK